MIQTLELTVILAKQETPTVRSIKLGFSGKFEYKPGQHAIVELDTGGQESNRPLSIASSPTEDFILLSTKISQSPFKKSYAGLKAGDKVNLMGPLGTFFLDEGAKHIVLMGGGIGITPFRSMIKYASDKSLPIKITLIYSNRNPNEICYKDEWPLFEKENKNLKVINTITEPEFANWGGRVGRINETLIKEFSDDFGNTLFYICGPPAMVDALLQILKSMSVPAKNIRIEKFAGY